MALAVAESGDGELLSCDSVQVYRELAIGCAKPTVEEQERVRHHLIDLVSWYESFDAQRYRTLAHAAIADVRQRGHQPILCGGTGLYLRAVRWGLVELPKADEKMRRALWEEEEKEPGCLYRRLQQIDPESAKKIEPNNLVYVMRALEITLSCGRPASVVRRAHGFMREEQPMRVVALAWPRPLLRRRIEERTERMLAGGLLREVEELLQNGVDQSCRPMRSVGYKEACDVVCGRASGEGLAERIIKSTVAYARRQETWLRRERDVTWLPVNDLSQTTDAVVALNRQLSRAMAMTHG